MRIEQFSDEHGIYFRASEEAFLVTKEEAASLREYIDELRELVRDMWHEGMCECGSRGKCERCMYDYPNRMRELGVDDG